MAHLAAPCPAVGCSRPAASFVGARLLGGAFGAFGCLLAWVVGSVLRIRRAHVVRSMRLAGIRAPERVATRMYRSLGRGVGELLCLLCRPGSLGGNVRIDPRQFLDWLGGPRGAVLATAHTANWDLVACGLAESLPLTVITKHLRVRWLDRLWQGLRRREGVRLLAAGSASRAALAALRRGELVAMLVDQAPERRRAAIRAEFLGQVAWVDLVPALVAMRAHVPLAVAFPKREPDGTLVAELGTVLLPPRVPSHRWAEEAMREATAGLERFVRGHPEQWLWMHRRWKDNPGPRDAAPSTR